MWLIAMLAVGALATDTETSTTVTVKTVQASNAQFEVKGWVERETITSGERKDLFVEWAHMKIVRKSDGATWEGPFDNAIGIDAVVATGESQFVTITPFPMSMGHRVARWEISDTLTPTIVEELNCYWPYLAPNQQWVFYRHWYPRMGTPKEYQHTSTWMVDITKPAFKPVLVYPADDATGAAPDGRVHDALTGGPAPLWTPDSRKLYYFDRLSQDRSWNGAVVSLVEVQIGGDMTIEKTTTFPVRVEDFAKPGADLAKLAFYPEELYWAKEGVIGVALRQEGGWKSDVMRMTIAGEYLNPEEGGK